MLEAAKVISLIQRTSGYNDKLYLLKKNENVPGVKDILRFIYNPYHKTGISTAKLNKALAFAQARGSYVMGNEPFVSYQEMIKYLKKYNTGSDADLSMAARFINCTKGMYESDVKNTFVDLDTVLMVAKAIITQDLQIGVTVKSLNTVYGEGFIPTVGCMLGTKIGDVPSHKVKWPCIVTEKLDGIRRVLIKENGVCRFYSRSGHLDTGLVELEEEARYLPDNRVYDGELLAKGTFVDSIALRQATNSIANQKGVKHGLTFNVFDMLPIEEFYAGKSDDSARVRKILLAATFMDESIQYLFDDDNDWPKYIASYGTHKAMSFIRSVPILGFVKNLTDVDPIVASIWARGGEGVMLNTADGFYEIKRSKSLLKVKHTEEAVLTVVDLIEGTGKYEDMLGAVVVEYKGNKLGVGSGFDDAQRYEIWNNPDKYIGKKIEVDTFGESRNQQGAVSLNCPIFKRFVGHEE